MKRKALIEQVLSVTAMINHVFKKSEMLLFIKGNIIGSPKCRSIANDH